MKVPTQQQPARNDAQKTEDQSDKHIPLFNIRSNLSRAKISSLFKNGGAIVKGKSGEKTSIHKKDEKNQTVDIQDVSPIKKALRLNLDPEVYGTFAEIGAGQDVARTFFLAGRASQTVAKTMSAYDMTFSDAIYGKTGRYVSQERLRKMLDHEFALLVERLNASRGAKTCFFAFADTVSTHQDLARCHGWMGLRFQKRPQEKPHEIIFHVWLQDRFRLQQQEALGILGVNLIEASFYHSDSVEDFLDSLTDNLHKRIEIDMLHFCEEAPKAFDNRLVSLELVRRGLTDAVLFGPSGDVLQPSDALFKKPVLVQRGTFRPVTNTNVEILNRGLQQLQSDWKTKDAQVLFEITMHNLSADGQLNPTDFLQRVDTLSALGHSVMISNYFLFYGLKSFLRRHTDQPIGLVIGASHLEKLFDVSFYKELPGGVLEAFSRLFDDKTRLYVFPFKSEQLCVTSQTFTPEKNLRALYVYLRENHFVTDIAGCDDVDTSIHSQDIRDMLARQDSHWETLVPPAVCKRIKELKLFKI